MIPAELRETDVSKANSHRSYKYIPDFSLLTENEDGGVRAPVVTSLAML